MPSLTCYIHKSRKLNEIYFGLMANAKESPRYIEILEFYKNITEADENQSLQDVMIISKETLVEGKVIDFCELKSFSCFPSDSKRCVC